MTVQHHDRDQARVTRVTRHKPVQRASPSFLDVIERSLSKGVVVKRRLCARVLDIDVLSLEADAFMASFERYLDYAEALEQIDEIDVDAPEQLPPYLTEQPGDRHEEA